MKVKDTFEAEPIHGFIVGKDNNYKWFIPTSADYSYDIDDCTLIARPISDMTDEEIEELSFCEKCKDRDFFLNILLERCNSDNLRFEDARHLIDNGLYPGPQSHFDDGTVID